VHVRGTPLWIDAAVRRPLCVVTSIIDRLPPAHARLLATVELARLLAAAGHKSKVLPTPRDRWVGVGGERLQLVEAGPHGLAAGAQVTLADEIVLVTGPLRAATVDWPRADHIVAHLPALQHRGEDLDVTADAIANAAARDRCSVRVESLEIAQAVITALHARGVVCAGRGLLRHLEAPQRAPGRVSVGLGRLPHAGVGRRIDVDSGLARLKGSAAQRLALRWYADRRAVQELAQSTSVRRLTLVGNRDPRLDLPGEVVWRSEPLQLVLEAAAEG
jgi:hypothetical protein